MYHNDKLNHKYLYLQRGSHILAVSTRPPAGKKLEFSRRLRASVRSFISIHQVTAATALLILCAWFAATRQVSLT